MLNYNSFHILMPREHNSR